MINAKDFREEVVRPSLRALAEYHPRLYSEDAVELLLGTSAQESDLGYFLTQIGNHPLEGLGPYSMELATSDSIWEHYLAFRPELASIVRSLMTQDAFDSPENLRRELINNSMYSTAMARIKYWKVPDPMPTTLWGWAAYWKEHFNTHLGKGTEEEFVVSYRKFVKGGF